MPEREANIYARSVGRRITTIDGSASFTNVIDAYRYTSVKLLSTSIGICYEHFTEIDIKTGAHAKMIYNRDYF